MKEVLEILDAAAVERVVIFGSLPPDARDVDVVARTSDARALRQALSAEGFVPKRDAWARFEGCHVDSVDVVPVEGWNVGRTEAEALFERSILLEGRKHIARPAPHHVLLIAARRLVRGDGRLEQKKRARVIAAGSEDDRAWERARDAAAEWGATSALSALEATIRTGEPVPLQVRIEALTEQGRAHGGSSVGARLRSLRHARGRRRGGVVSFSGLEGSGKSTQATALSTSLERLGYESVVQWTRLSYNPSLDVIARPLKRVLTGFRRGDAGDLRPTPMSKASVTADPGKALRQRSRILTWGWATVVAIANTVAQRRATVRHVRAGRVVVCDRYTLDSSAHLRYRYGPERGYRFQKWVVRTFSPRPVEAFLLEITPEESLARKPEQYDLAQLTVQARLYREEGAALKATILDGTRPAGDLCEEVARAVWRSL